MTYLVFGQPIRQPVHLHSDGRKRSHLRYPLTARTRNTQANNNFRLPDIDTSTPADHHILSSLRPPNPFPAVQPGGITRVNDAVRRAHGNHFRGAERDLRPGLYCGLPAPRNSDLTRAHHAPFSRHRGGHRPCWSLLVSRLRFATHSSWPGRWGCNGAGLRGFSGGGQFSILRAVWPRIQAFSSSDSDGEWRMLNMASPQLARRRVIV